MMSGTPQSADGDKVRVVNKHTGHNMVMRVCRFGPKCSNKEKCQFVHPMGGGGGSDQAILVCYWYLVGLPCALGDRCNYLHVVDARATIASDPPRVVYRPAHAAYSSPSMRAPYPSPPAHASSSSPPMRAPYPSPPTHASYPPPPTHASGSSPLVHPAFATPRSSISSCPVAPLGPVTHTGGPATTAVAYERTTVTQTRVVETSYEMASRAEGGEVSYSSRSSEDEHLRAFFASMGVREERIETYMSKATMITTKTVCAPRPRTPRAPEVVWSRGCATIQKSDDGVHCLRVEVGGKSFEVLDMGSTYRKEGQSELEEDANMCFYNSVSLALSGLGDQEPDRIKARLAGRANEIEREEVPELIRTRDFGEAGVPASLSVLKAFTEVTGHALNCVTSNGDVMRLWAESGLEPVWVFSYEEGELGHYAALVES